MLTFLNNFGSRSTLTDTIYRNVGFKIRGILLYLKIAVIRGPITRYVSKDRIISLRKYMNSSSYGAPVAQGQEAYRLQQSFPDPFTLRFLDVDGKLFKCYLVVSENNYNIP
jgi:hypothetical protein